MKCKLCWLFIKFPFSYLLLLPQQKQRGSCLTQKGSTGLKLVQHILFYKQEWQLLTQIMFYINNRIIYSKWRRSELRMSCFVQPPTVAFTIIPHRDGFKHWKTSTVASSAVWDWARIFVKKIIIIIHSQNIQNQAHYGRMICRTFKITVKHLKSQNTFASI